MLIYYLQYSVYGLIRLYCPFGAYIRFTFFTVNNYYKNRIRW